MMKKRGALLLILVLVASMLAACGAQTPEQIAATVVAEVGGEKITKGEAQPVYDFVSAQTQMIAAQYGQSVDATNTAYIAEAKAVTLSFMTELMALEQKLASMDMGLTEAELAEIQATAADEYEKSVTQYVESYSVSDEEARTALNGMGYSQFALAYMLRSEAVETKVRDIATTDIAIEESEIEAKYNELVASSETAYAATASEFVNDYLGGNTVYSRPEGFRFVKNLVIGFPEDIDAQITEKDNEYYALMLEEYNTQNELASETEKTDEEKAALQAKLDGYAAEFERIEAEIEELNKKGFGAIKVQADEILAEAKAEGADFDALIAAHGMDNPPTRAQETGYPVAAGIDSYIQSFIESAMALGSVGDISELVESEYGYHILKYESDVTPGPVSYEELHDTVEGLVLAEKQDNAVTALKEEWLNAAKIKTYLNKF